jgi:NADPH-dependent 2,4-dienoyl-CoA reductase/sulfur reductase-like enzyme
VFEQAPRSTVARFGLRLARHPRKLTQAAALLAHLRGVPLRYSAWPLRATGDAALRDITVWEGGRQRSIETDLLACSFGLTPATGLATLLGCALRHGRVVVDEHHRTTVDGVWCAGESTGVGGVDLAHAEGEVAGRAAAGELDRARTTARRVRSERRFAESLDRTFTLRPELRELPLDDTVVCRCEDVPWARIRAHHDARQAKLETRCGMGPCQGRVCGPALEVLCGWERERPRPPLIPVPFHALADAGSAGVPSPRLPSSRGDRP